MKRIKYSQVERIRKLEMNLEAYCVGKGVTEIPGSFLVMYDDESGNNILFVRDMNKDATGTARDLYNTRLNVKWPYTGFVIGSILGWKPINPEKIMKILQRYGYSIKDFEHEFEKYRI